MRYRRTVMQVDLDAIIHNIKLYRSRIPEDGHLMAVVKADGYGHGAIPILKAAMEAGVTWAAIALVEEGIELRKAGFDLPILILGGWFPEAMEAFIEYDITPTLYSLPQAYAFNEFLVSKGKRAKVHLNLDTGMSRLGLPNDSLQEMVSHASQFSALEVDGIWTHLSSSDEGDPTFTLLQLNRFHQRLAVARKVWQPQWIHVANSAGTSDFSCDRGNLFRVGIGMYGQPPSEDLRLPLPLKEAVSWKTSIAQIQSYPAGTPIGYGRTFTTSRNTRVATLCMGYADGYSRLLSNRYSVLVQGKRAPILGRVCMDMTMIDVTDIPQAKVFDEVVLIGRQEDEYLSATDMANCLQTINYEITCNISKRVPREYKKNGNTIVG